MTETNGGSAHYSPGEYPAQGSEPQSSAPRIPRARSVERQALRRQRAQSAPARIARSFVEVPQHISPAVLVIVFLLLVFLAVSIAAPARNYFEQRAELAQIQDDIARRQQEKQTLTEELNRFNNEDYIREQARTRLGLIEPGESAYRIISPQISTGTAAADPGKDVPEETPEWYSQLWTSISTPDIAEETPEEAALPEKHQLPTVPDAPLSQ